MKEINWKIVVNAIILADLAIDGDRKSMELALAEMRRDGLTDEEMAFHLCNNLKDNIERHG